MSVAWSLEIDSDSNLEQGTELEVHVTMPKILYRLKSLVLPQIHVKYCTIVLFILPQWNKSDVKS